MKTAGEILKKHMSIDKDSRYSIGLGGTILNSMKEYAKEVAKEALKNASENATYILDANDEVNIVKSSIASEENIPKL